MEVMTRVVELDICVLGLSELNTNMNLSMNQNEITVSEGYDHDGRVQRLLLNHALETHDGISSREEHCWRHPMDIYDNRFQEGDIDLRGMG